MTTWALRPRLGAPVCLRILPTVTGSHVPRFAAAGDLHNVPYLVMEYVHGQTLQHWLHLLQRPVVDEAARLGVAMALAAHNLHEKNTVHLDLKPENVLIRPDGTAVLLDFVLSCPAMPCTPIFWPSSCARRSARPPGWRRSRWSASGATRAATFLPLA